MADPPSYESQFPTLHRRAYALAYRLLGRPATTEDVAQETLARGTDPQLRAARNRGRQIVKQRRRTRIVTGSATLAATAGVAAVATVGLPGSATATGTTGSPAASAPASSAAASTSAAPSGAAGPTTTVAPSASGSASAAADSATGTGDCAAVGQLMSHAQGPAGWTTGKGKPRPASSGAAGRAFSTSTWSACRSPRPRSPLGAPRHCCPPR